MYNYSQHIAFDIIGMLAKPMHRDMAETITYHIKQCTNIDESERAVAIRIAELLHDHWKTDDE